jgi:hypothetical protein
MSSSHVLLKFFRQVHLYLGVFITPSLIFFAFTGALQTFSLHETTRGSSYKPPAWAVTLAQIHKKQTPVVPARHAPPSDRPAGEKTLPGAGQSTAQTNAPAPTPTAKTHNSLPLKIFFLVVSIGLFISTLTGLYMSYRFVRNRLLITSLLVAGVVIPIALTLL